MTKKITKKSKELSAKVTVLAKADDVAKDDLLYGVGKVRTVKATTKSNALQAEDEFMGAYGMSSLKGFPKDVVIIEPPFNPNTLDKLTKHNNTLGACISTMETNIDGTGFEIINRKDPEDNIEDDVDGVVERAKAFFNEPWPGESFRTIRKKLRRDIEKIGYGTLEVIRNPKDEIVFIRYVDAKTMRLVKLGEAMETEVSINRDGRAIKAKVMLRPRRFVQKIGTKYIFFKEFQSKRDLDVDTGRWAEDGQRLPDYKRATEIWYFSLDKDVNTPYGVPRWIEQMPSVLGSRRAEENNLEFFESGGVPPFMLFVQGGVLATETRTAIEQQLSQSGSGKQRGIVVEAYSSSGSIDDNNNVKVTVEKFGAGATGNKDSSFENYDDKCSGRVRRSFRFSPIFLGNTDAYNFASAVASYMLGETQVFKPERDAFDEEINLKLMPEILGAEDAAKVTFRSIPITVNDAAQKLEAIGMAADKQAVTKGEFVAKINEITGLSVRVAEGEENNLPRLNQRGSEDARTPQGQDETEQPVGSDLEDDEEDEDSE